MGIGESILADPHQLSWLLLAGFGILGVAAFMMSKARRPRRQRYVRYHKQFDIAREGDELVPEQD